MERKCASWIGMTGLRMIFLALGLVWVLGFSSCNEGDDVIPIENATDLTSRLSDYQIFQGSPSALVPDSGFHLYELSTQLFTDYAEKQRLIHIPAGEEMTPVDHGLPVFPEGTMLVKTFYYYHDKRDTSAGKRLIETRIMLRSAGGWSIGTYIWNNSQTEAYLFNEGLEKEVQWIDGTGASRNIQYHVPKHDECTTCHQADEVMIPIGPKLQNLNRDVERANASINQLQYFQDSALMSAISPSTVAKLPNWENTSLSLEERARAYLDVNCSHCHNSQGFAARVEMQLGYQTPFAETKIDRFKNAIRKATESGEMPKIGTTILHDEGVALIKEYVESLQ